MSQAANGGRAIKIDTTAEISSEQGTLTMSFPREGGVLTSGRWTFRDRDDLVEYLADILRLPVINGGISGTVRRRGKYSRTNAQGDSATTFGDPILDLITNDHGELVIGGHTLSVGSAELREPKYRMGGIATIDLSTCGQDLADYQLRRAAAGDGNFVITEHTDGFLALASTNPSQRDYFQDGDHLRFKAWRKNRYLYWSMGAEVETWGHDFDSARIDSRYLDTFVGQTCTTVKVDSDSDTNDDYLDEYEWGITAPQPRRVVSLCTARWKGRTITAQVEAGAECFEV